MRPNLWVLSYDIVKPRSRRQLAEWALDHGNRVQRSLYELTLTHDQVEIGAHHIRENIDLADDRVMLRPVCRACRKGTRFQGGSAENVVAREPFWIV
jgi:CRISPR-associated protein Cas2